MLEIEERPETWPKSTVLEREENLWAKTHPNNAWNKEKMREHLSADTDLESCKKSWSHNPAIVI